MLNNQGVLLLVPLNREDISVNGEMLLSNLYDFLLKLIDFEEKEWLATVEFKVAIDKDVNTRKKALSICLHNKKELQDSEEISKEYNLMVLENTDMEEAWDSVLEKMRQAKSARNNITVH